MPGGRLTLQEREQIAAGLAEGAGYAAISRRLGKPTSTISREVARNGGASAYQPDHAQLATGQRARRSKQTAPTAPPPPIGGYGRDPDAVAEFAERFAVMIAQTGVSRMAARVLTQLFTTDSGSVTAAELTQRLQVSPASVSKAVSYLETLELIRRERDPGWRRERYFVDDDVWRRSWMSSARTNALWAETARQGADVLQPGTPAGARLQQASRFFARLNDNMVGGMSSKAVVDDALTLLAALVEARAPLTENAIAAALAWPPDRVSKALRDAQRHPDMTDPVALARTETGDYTVAAKRDRLSPEQRAALGRPNP
jgi:DNA-binding transcriptional ArsR family regulator